MLKALPLLIVLAQTPAPAPRDGVITGQVVDASSGRPVAAAIVSISGGALGGRIGPGSGAPPRILTGSDGRFVFRDLPLSNLTIVASKGGYSEGASGRRVIGGASQPVVLTAAQKTAETSIRIWKNAAIAGTVVDEAGEPAVGLQVRAMRRMTIAGRRRFVGSGPLAATDDRGMYRLSGLPPGEYIVTTSQPPVSANASAFADARTGRGSGAELASMLAVPGTLNGIQVGEAQMMLGRGGAIPPPPAGRRMQIYPPIFYPSAFTPALATSIALASGEERLGIDLQLQPVATVRIAGTVMGASGPAGLLPLRLLPAGLDDIAPEAPAPMSVTDGSGSFTFVAVPQGQYRLQARTRTGSGGSGPGSDLHWLDMPLNVSGDDMDGVVAVMRPGLRITARLEFDGALPRPPGRTQVAFVGAPFVLDPDDSVAPAGLTGIATSAGEQGVTLAGFVPGRYRVRVQNSPAGWMFKAAMLNGVDVSETAFEFTRDVTDLVLMFTDRWSGMSGVVQGTGAGGAMVLAFTTNPQAWENTGIAPRRMKNARANAKGEFALSSVPPGEYYVVAVPEEQVSDWRDPKMLDALARLATQVSVGDGEHRTIDLRLKEVRQ